VQGERDDLAFTFAESSYAAFEGQSRMNWAWATSLEQTWRSPAFPMWLTLAAAAFFGVVALFTLVRAEKSVANGALTVITLLAIGISVAATIRAFGPDGESRIATAETSRRPQPINPALPALACVDDLAGDVVLAACERAVFGSAEAAAAALSYAASLITRLASFGDVAAANRSMTPDLDTLRRAVERDRYGLMAQVLLVRDRCTPSNCTVFRALTDYRQLASNMDERLYDALIARYAPTWNALPAAATPLAALTSSVPTGKPTNAEFPSAASTPPVSIMTPEPSATTASSPPRTPTPPSAANAPTLPARSAAPATVAAKKQASPKHSPAPPQHTSAPVQLAPAPGAPTSAPAASND
jgi:hypothetical protein